MATSTLDSEEQALYLSNAIASLQLLPRQPCAAHCQSAWVTADPLPIPLIGRTCVADGDKTGVVLLFAAVLRALQCCHSARQDGDAIESCPLITTMQYTVGQLIRISPSSWFVYLFMGIFEMTAILKVQGDIWGAHFNMSISITLPWQSWDRLALWASCQSSLLSLYWIFSHKDSAVLCAADVWA